MKIRNIIENDLDIAGGVSSTAQRPATDGSLAKLSSISNNIQNDEQLDDSLEMSEEERKEIERQTVDRLRPDVRSIDKSAADVVQTFDKHQQMTNNAVGTSAQKYRTASQQLQNQLDKIGR